MIGGDSKNLINKVFGRFGQHFSAIYIVEYTHINFSRAVSRAQRLTCTRWCPPGLKDNDRFGLKQIRITPHQPPPPPQSCHPSPSSSPPLPKLISPPPQAHLPQT